MTVVIAVVAPGLYQRPRTAFYQRREVKAALAHLTLLVNPHDAEPFSRVMLDARRGIGEVTAARVDAHAVAASISLLEACVRADHLCRVRRDQKATLIAFGRAMLDLREQLDRRWVSSLLADVVRLPGGLADILARPPVAVHRRGAQRPDPPRRRLRRRAIRSSRVHPRARGPSPDAIAAAVAGESAGRLDAGARVCTCGGPMLGSRADHPLRAFTRAVFLCPDSLRRACRVSTPIGHRTS